jgi:hypothetical protein
MQAPFSSEKLPGRHRGARAERGVLVSLAEHERGILVQLLQQLDELLDDGSPASEDPLAQLTGMSELPPDQPVPTPDDPAVARLLPEGAPDPGLAQEYRRLTEFGLRARKRGAARTAAEALRRPEPVLLHQDEALSLLKAMTDVRLVLGERLELRTDEDAEQLHEKLRGLGEPQSPEWLSTAAIYEILTMWQEYLVQAVSKAGGR